MAGGAPGHATNEPQNYFAMGVQGAKDQDAGTFYFFRHLDGTGFDVQSEMSPEREGGGGREIAINYKTKIKADGSVVSYAYPDCAGRLLAWALGADTPSVVATAGPLVNHLLLPGGSLPYLTADQTYADQSERTTNCVVSELKLDFEAGKPLKLTAQFMSGGSPHIATTAMAAVREAGQLVMYTGASAYIVAGVASSIELTKGSITIKNALDDGIQTTGLNREDLVWLTTEFDLDGTIKYENANIWNQVNFNGGSQVQFGIATGSFHIYAPQVGASQSVEIGMPLVQFTAVKLNRLDPDGKTMYLDFTAMTIKNATNSLFANVVSGATNAYTATAT